MLRPTLSIRRVTTKRLIWREYTLRIRYTYRYQRHRYFNGTRFCNITTGISDSPMNGRAVHYRFAQVARRVSMRALV